MVVESDSEVSFRCIRPLIAKLDSSDSESYKLTIVVIFFSPA